MAMPPVIMSRDERARWGSTTIYLLVLVCQTIGLSTGTTLPNGAISSGALGSLAIYVLAFLILGIPLLYMEMIVSQFTSRDCIAIWRIRPFLSHIGYFLVVWQVIILLINHCTSAFTLHYFILSFERVIPYNVCGGWADEWCNSLKSNYTLNEDCIRSNFKYRYCDNLHQTFSAYQFWRNFMLNAKSDSFLIAWQVCVSSAILCACLYICCFRRERSLQCFIWFLAFYPSVAYIVFLVGCMLQKGLLGNLTSALDGDFSIFRMHGKLTNAVVNAVYTLAVGTGISSNLAGSCAFRAPCYANAVIPVVVCAVFTVISVFSAAMSLCPFAFDFKIEPLNLADDPLNFLFEKMPLLLGSFDGSRFWLLLLYSSNTVLGLRATTILFFNLQELLATRYVTVARYPGVFCLLGVSLVFVGSTPMLSSFGMTTVANAFRHYLNLTSLFVIMLECFVFVVWYGLGRFSEDVHFMLGVHPSKYIKVVWVGSLLLFGYVFVAVAFGQKFVLNFSDLLGVTGLTLSLGGIVLISVTKLVYAAFMGRFKEAVSLDPNWGPKSEILRRSRTMFTGQAMTKEYIYRQYHLQAGIMARQRRSNKRAEELH